MCYYCKKIYPKWKRKWSSHFGIDCKEKENKYSGWYYAKDGIPNFDCPKCNKKTHFIWHECLSDCKICNFCFTSIQK